MGLLDLLAFRTVFGPELYHFFFHLYIAYRSISTMYCLSSLLIIFIKLFLLCSPLFLQPCPLSVSSTEVSHPHSIAKIVVAHCDGWMSAR